MELGFETIGNATLICHDRVPVLVTDPWLTGDAYFGSWTFSHEIPAEQMEAVRRCQYIWISHGHPDHLSGKSLETLKGKKILLPDHVGRRIYDGLKELGYDVHILKDKGWTQVSDRIRILCHGDVNQNALLLLDLDGRLIVNLNDAQEESGWGPFVREVIKRYPVSFLLCLTGLGDADMINIYDEKGERFTPIASKNRPLGDWIRRKTERFGARYFIPFSSLHRYQRSDSIWANEYAASLADYAEGFQSSRCEILPAFVRYDCIRDSFEPIRPAEKQTTAIDPEVFGDNWKDPLDSGEVAKLKSYFQSIHHLSEFLDFVNVRVGGRNHTIELGGKRFNRGIQFEVPRNSLMKAVNYEIFDDLLFGNFMKTTLFGSWQGKGMGALFPDVAPYIRYADNGRAKSEKEINAYFAEYRKRLLYHKWKSRLELLFTDRADFTRRTQQNIRQFVGRYFEVNK